MCRVLYPICLLAQNKVSAPSYDVVPLTPLASRTQAYGHVSRHASWHAESKWDSTLGLFLN